MADLNRISRNPLPLCGLEGRFERINQHPNAGSYSFSTRITEVLNSNLVIELSANDVEYVYQRIPGKIISVSVPTFEALTQFGVAAITTKNTSEVEASYSLTIVGLLEIEEFAYPGANELTQCKMVAGARTVPASFSTLDTRDSGLVLPKVCIFRFEENEIWKDNGFSYQELIKSLLGYSSTSVHITRKPSSRELNLAVMKNMFTQIKKKSDALSIPDTINLCNPLFHA